MVTSLDSLYWSNCLLGVIDNNLKQFGFESAPFLIGWYNDAITARCKIPINIAPYDDCLGICIISNSQMFENSFIPHLNTWFHSVKENKSKTEENGSPETSVTLKEAIACAKDSQKMSSLMSFSDILPSSNDALDWSVRLRLHDVLQSSINELCDLEDFPLSLLSHSKHLPDFAMHPVSRSPLIHVQTAGHVSGLAYFHRPSHTRGPGGNLSGCSLHPRLGGWFGFRGAFVFPMLRCPDLPQPICRSSLPPNIPPFPAEADLLHEYNHHWRDNLWRNFGLSSSPCDTETIKCRYSDKAQQFFNALPSHRPALVESWFENSVLAGN